MVVSHSSSVSSSNGFPIRTPALLIRVSMSPSEPVICSTMRATWSASPTSAVAPAASKPSASSSFTSCFDLGGGAGADAHPVSRACEREGGGSADAFCGAGDEGGF